MLWKRCCCELEAWKPAGMFWLAANGKFSVLRHLPIPDTSLTNALPQPLFSPPSRQTTYPRVLVIYDLTVQIEILTATLHTLRQSSTR